MLAGVVVALKMARRFKVSVAQAAVHLQAL
jgi:hypothetical protein